MDPMLDDHRASSDQPKGVPTVHSPAELRLERLRLLARLLDDSIKVPGTSWRIGIDAVVGLAPGVGDVIGLLASGYIIIESARLGASRPALLRMLYNTAIDGVLGSIPVVGDAFDAGWKANLKNVELLRRHLEHPELARAASRRFGVTVVGALVLVVVAVTLATVLLLGWLLQRWTG